MAYEKTNWNTGDIITAEKLNHAEQGIADASSSESNSLCVVIRNASGRVIADTPVADISRAIDSGKHVCAYLMTQESGSDTELQISRSYGTGGSTIKYWGVVSATAKKVQAVQITQPPEDGFTCTLKEFTYNFS